jgi:hypothetical protein
MGLMRLTPRKSEGLSEHFLPKPSHQEVSEDAKPPRTGPAFLRLNSIAYRLEMLLMTIILLVVLFYWRLFVVKDLNLLATVFWIIFPDLASFIPIGLTMRGAKDWPYWGPGLYNFFHTFLVWIPVFAVWSILSGAIQWPLLGWAGHITADRSVGYYLRAAKGRVD